MPDYYSENGQNAKIILNFLKKSQAKTVLDICCGTYDEAGTNYDQNGLIYQPIVAQTLGKNGYEVTGIDFRSNKTLEQIYYQHTTGINVLQSNWTEKLSSKFDVAIFLRSWDTPEILFRFQDNFPLLSLNELSIKIAQSLLPDIINCLNPKGLLIISEIFNFGLCDSCEEIDSLKKEALLIFSDLGFKLLKEETGLYFLELISN